MVLGHDQGTPRPHRVGSTLPPVGGIALLGQERIFGGRGQKSQKKKKKTLNHKAQCCSLSTFSLNPQGAGLYPVLVYFNTSITLTNVPL